eukprot:TRINITY_DN5971_c0_g1_i1.p1 TRINITY_DN5971_c0_g1~~TRINITY_DN5971_c0_g1_i1.p1  ORF type:complete len:117 (-),score=25.90 TRINITY_DN5971_c0_g1_i1:63-413(-)
MFQLSSADTLMDFQGQKEAKSLFKTIITIAGVIGWILGFIQQNFLSTAIIVIAATAGACFVCVPPYERFRQNQIQFLDPKNPPQVGGGSVKKSSQSGKNGKGSGKSGKSSKKKGKK